MSRAMQSFDRTQPLSDEHPDDLPRRPMRFAAYYERELQARVRAAYERGLAHGSRRQPALFVIGLILGWLLNASVRG